MGADDDPQGVGPGRSDGSLGPWPEVVVPDDLSALAADVEAYRAEQRAAARRVARTRRRARAHPLWRWLIPRDHPIAPGFTAPRPRRLLLPLTMTGIAMLLCAVVTVLLTMFAPQPNDTARRPPAPLATGPGVGVYPAAAHGLLPDVTLTAGARVTGGSHRDVRDLRPGLVVLLPTGCDCRELIGQVVQAAGSEELDAFAVSADSRTLTQALDVPGVTAYLDPADQLGPALKRSPAGSPLVVIVNADGRVLDALSGPKLAEQMTNRVQQLFAGR